VEVLSSLTTNNKFHGSKNPVATYEVCFFFGGKFQEQAYNIMGYQLRDQE
jgi:hypothetical protein